MPRSRGSDANAGIQSHNFDQSSHQQCVSRDFQQNEQPRATL